MPSKAITISPFIAALLFLAARACGADLVVRVGLWPEDHLPRQATVTGSLTVEASGKRWRASALTVTESSGSLKIQGQTMRPDSLRIRCSREAAISARGATPVVLNAPLRLIASPGGLQCIADVDLEQYTARVLAREMPLNWPSEALAAQAVVARSAGLASRGRHGQSGYDVCALTHCQLFSPRPAPAAALLAARRTAGWVLTRGGRPVRAPFFSTCGGWTADGGSIGMESWCTPVQDGPTTKPYCRASPHFSWRTTLSSADIQAVFQASAGNPVILKRDSGGRVTRIGLKGQAVSLDGGQFLMRCGRALGWARVKSCRFTVKKAGNNWLFSGHGLGHGVGMCQWGARGMAMQGKSWQQILRHYYTHATLRRSP